MRVPRISVPLRRSASRSARATFTARFRIRPNLAHLTHRRGGSQALRSQAVPLALRSRRAPRPVAACPAVAVPGVSRPAPASGDAASSDRELRGRVWSLALPAIGEQLLALGVGVSDTFLAGHLLQRAVQHLGYGPATAVAAVGVASTAVWVCLTAFFAVNVGVTALVARAVGSGDKALAAKAAGQGVLLGAAIGLAMVALAVPLASAITAALGVSGQVAALAATYIRVFSIALPATGAASALTAAMRGAGDARRPLLVMLFVNGANIAGSWTLMNGLPALGIAPIGVIGSACGAAAGWLLGCALAVALLARTHPRAPKLTLPALRPDREVAVRILRVGLPSAGELVVFQLGIVTFNRVVVGLGATIYAANITINTVESMGTLPGFGFAVATTTLVGQALGAVDAETAVRATRLALWPCVAVMGAIGLLALLVPQVMVGLFVNDPGVVAAGTTAMRLSVITLPASAAVFVFNGALRGAGDTRFPVLVRATGTWGVRLPVALCIIPLLALPGARIAMALDFCTQAGLAYWRFRGGRWRRASV